jgi:hypothetical protein
MRSFTDYVRTRNEDVQPPVAPDAPDADQSSDSDVDPAEQKVLDACEIAVRKYRPQIERFLRKLSENDSELRTALDGAGSAPPVSDRPASPDLAQPSADVAPAV